MSHENVDSWESRIEQVAQILGKTVDEVEEILNAEPFRLTQDPNRLEMLSDEDVTPFGDLRKMFCDENGVSLPQLRMCMKVMRGPKESVKASQMDSNMLGLKARYGLETSLDDLGIDQILEFYNPKKRDKVHEIIRERYEDRYGAVIAFKPDSTKVAIEETLDYISDLEAGLPTETSLEVDGEHVRLYRVGETPNEKIDEDPLFPGTPLRRDRSTVNRVNWKDISLSTRQFFRLLVQEDLIDPNDRVELRKIIQLDIKELKDIFPEVSVVFKELDKDGNLPKLTLSTSSLASTKKQDPFAIRRNRVR